MILFSNDFCHIIKHDKFFEVVFTITEKNFSFENYTENWQLVRNSLVKEKAKFVLIDKRFSELFLKTEPLEYLKCKQWFRNEILIDLERIVKKIAFVVTTDSIIKPTLHVSHADSKTATKVFKTPSQAIYWLRSQTKNGFWFWVSYLENFIENSSIYKLSFFFFRLIIIVYLLLNIVQKELYSNLYDCYEEVKILNSEIEFLKTNKNANP